MNVLNEKIQARAQDWYIHIAERGETWGTEAHYGSIVYCTSHLPELICKRNNDVNSLIRKLCHVEQILSHTFCLAAGGEGRTSATSYLAFRPLWMNSRPTGRESCCAFDNKLLQRIFVLLTAIMTSIWG